MSKILFLNVYYDTFLQSHYRDNPHLLNKPYQEQLESIQGTMFGDSDFYSHGMELNGWQAWDIITNCEYLQRAWCEEVDTDYTESEDTVIKQILFYEPDVVYTQGLWVINPRVHDAIRATVKVITGHVGSALDSFVAPRFDVLFSSIPRHVLEFNKAGTEAHYLALAFDPRALNFPMPKPEVHYPVTFVGQISGGHKQRRDLLDYLSDHIDIYCWGPGFNELSRKDKIHYRGEAWGPDMFRTLRSSCITLNCKIDHADPWVGNMRMFEATGCGALLFNDTGMNLPDLFDCDKEIVVYEDWQDCLEKVNYYLEHTDEACEIAANGNARTMKDHTYQQRMKYVGEILEAKL